MELTIMIFTLVLDLVIAVNGVLKKKCDTPYSIFAFIWAVILIIYMLARKNWYDINLDVSVAIFFGNICFVSAAFFVEKIRLTKLSKSIEIKVVKDNPNYGLILILTIVTIVWLSGGLPERVAMLMQGLSFNDIYLQNLRNDNVSSTSLISSLIAVLVARPFCYCSLCILTNEIYKEQYRKKWVIISQFLIMILSVLQNGRRAMLIYWFFIMLIEGIRRGRFNFFQRFDLKYKIMLAFFGVIILGAMVWVSDKRDSDLFNSMYVYFAGGIPSFSERSLVVIERYYGLGLLHGFLVPVMIALHGVFHISYPDWYMQLDKYVEAADYIQIGPNSWINAFNTLYYIPYLDGGVVFVIIEMFVLGAVYGIIYERLKCTNSYGNKCRYELLILGIVGSAYTLYFTQYPFAIAFIYIWLISRNCGKFILINEKGK